MKSNYKRIGEYIQELKVRNTEEKAKQLLEECKKLIDNPAFAKDIEEYIKTF
jgi:hypothetical protein